MILIFVCGPARSGTSALAGLVNRMGAHRLPTTVVGGYNQDYMENSVVNALCESIHPWHALSPTGLDPTHARDALAYYITEHVAMIEYCTGRDVDHLVLKSPSFPFVLPDLIEAARKVAEIRGESLGFVFLASRRKSEDIAQSADEFTLNVFGEWHWRRVSDQAYRELEKYASTMWVNYEDLLEDWEREAGRIADAIHGLYVPEDGGIDARLNHRGIKNAS